MAWTKGQITKIAYNAKGATKNPTMNRYLPCCMVTDPDRIADATTRRRVDTRRYWCL